MYRAVNPPVRFEPGVCVNPPSPITNINSNPGKFRHKICATTTLFCSVSAAVRTACEYISNRKRLGGRLQTSPNLNPSMLLSISNLHIPHVLAFRNLTYPPPPPPSPPDDLLPHQITFFFTPLICTAKITQHCRAEELNEGGGSLHFQSHAVQ